LSDGFLSSLSDVWGHLELLEMQKLGIKLTQVEDAYRHVATLPIADLLFDSSFKVQTENIRNIVNTLPTCPLHQKVVAAELGLASYVVYDTQDTTQACVARVMSLLLQNQRWLVQMCDNEFQEIENAVRVSAVALIFMTGNLIKNPMCVGFLALLDSRDMPMVTVLSQSDFPSSDKKWLAKLGAGRAFTPSDKEIMNNTISGAGGVRPTDMEIADPSRFWTYFTTFYINEGYFLQIRFFRDLDFWICGKCSHAYSNISILQFQNFENSTFL